MKCILLLSACIFSYLQVTAQEFKILSQLQVSENMYAASLQIKRNQYGIGLLNNKGVMGKEQTVEAIPLDLSLLGDNVLLITASEKNYKTTGYNAMLFNKRSMAVVQERSLFKKDNSNRISHTLLKDDDNNFGYVLFRETKFDEGFKFMGPSNFDTKYLESSSIQVVSLNNKLEPKTIPVQTEALNNFFAGACADAKRNIYICSFTKTAMLMEQFDSTGKFIAKLSAPFSVWKNPGFHFLMKNDRDDPGCITIASTCLNDDKKNVHHVMRFNFTNNKVAATGEIILNKEYLKSLVNTNTDAKGKNFSFVEGIEPIQILEDAGRLIVVKEIFDSQAGGKGEATTHFRNGAIITVYNKKTLAVDRDIVVDKRFATFVEQSEGIYSHLKDKYLWAITCETSGLASFKSYLSKINLNTGEVIKTEIEKEDIGKGTATFPKQTAWFKKEIAVPFLKITSPFSLSFETEFKLIPY